MKLKRLEIQGFKSFPEKTEIVFEQGTTAIVGPNGSGKSNIADAVRWVLGEQSARQLRGARMEDVIFGGTEKRKAQGWCEVSLLFDNEDRALDMDCAEVMVTRRVYRSGEGEYYLNRAACRLRDITELFRDTGIGKDGYSHIGQGRIDEILSARSDDRREVFEEAAGIVTYRARKEEAERRMENTRQNLARVEDILSELESQLEPLAEQAEDARKYIALLDTLKGLELNAFLIHHDRLKSRAAQHEQTLASLDAQAEAAAPLIEELSAKRDALDREADEAAERDELLSARVLEAARALEAQEGANNVLRERVAHAESDATREAARAMEEEGRAATLESLRAENAADEEARAAALEEARAALAELEQSLSNAQAVAASREEALEAHKAAIVDAMNRMSDMRSAQARLTALKQSLTGRLEEAEREKTAYGEGNAAFEDGVREAEAALAGAEDALKTLEAEAKALDELVHRDAERNESLLDMLRERTGKRHEAVSRLAVLREMARDYEGYQYAVRQALLHARGNARVHGVVAGVLKTPREYERAMDMVLGASLQHIITEDEHDAKRLIAHLKDNNYGRATFLPLSTVTGRVLTPKECEVLTMPGCVGVASELVRFEARYRGIVENLLGRTVVAEDLDAGIEIMRRGRHAFRLVTLDGNVMHSGGSMTGGSTGSRVTSLLSRSREIDEHEALVAKLAEEINAIQDELDKIDAGRADLKRERGAIFERAHQAEIAVAREQEHLGRARAEMAAHMERGRQAEALSAQIRANLQDIEEQLETALIAQDGGELDQTDMQARTQALQAALTESREKVEALREDVSRARVSFAGQEKELIAVRREGERLRGEGGGLEASLKRREAERAERARARAEDEARLAEGEAKHATLAAELEARRQAQSGCAQARQAAQAKARETTARLDALREDIARDAERRHRAEILLVRAQGELKALQDRIWSEYELTYAGALECKIEPFDLREAEKQIAEMRAEIRRMGSVNVNAVEDFRLTKERFDALTAQKDDLLRATADLENIIAELLSKMERRFRRQFAELNRYFGQTFALLFGGGHAELKLTDERDVLGCAIDVIAQPPGKKLQLLTLLSGGERALTAIAILFAMLQLKPTPFCVLDEIEAALDEANVANFADYLNDFSKKTQFVVVTHRRGTMERCQALYGVAMEEKGVSRMVSVRLADAQ